MRRAADFEQGLCQRTFDVAPEIERKAFVTEIRRLHEVNAELEEVNDALHEALAKCLEQLTRLGYSANHADAAIAKAEGEMK